MAVTAITGMLEHMFWFREGIRRQPDFDPLPPDVELEYQQAVHATSE